MEDACWLVALQLQHLGVESKKLFNFTTHLSFSGPDCPSCSASPTVAQSPPFYGTLMPCRYASLNDRIGRRLLAAYGIQRS